LKVWVLDNLEWLLALGVTLGVVAIGLIFMLWRAFLQQRETLDLLEVRFGTLQEQSQRELLAMGQRVIEAEKNVRRFSERIEALEAATPAVERYGQLGSLLAGKLLAGDSETASEAELALKSLLQRGKPE
jgi:hypothetical protein